MDRCHTETGWLAHLSQDGLTTLCDRLVFIGRETLRKLQTARMCIRCRAESRSRSVD